MTSNLKINKLAVGGCSDERAVKMQIRDDIKFVDLPRNITEAQGLKKSFVQYLIESEIRPLIFIGKTMQYFGTKVVVSFVFGVLILYGYALFKPLPYATSHAKTILLHGKVINGEEKPLTDFVIGVLESKHGPIKREDGSFSIEVPLKSKYSFIIWDNKNELTHFMAT